MQRRTFIQASGAAAATLGAPRLFAQQWPNGPVRIVVGFPPGGGTDALARVVAQKLTTMWNQQVIVESKPGVAGVLAAEYVAQQPSDGSTLLIRIETDEGIEGFGEAFGFIHCATTRHAVETLIAPLCIGKDPRSIASSTETTCGRSISEASRSAPMVLLDTTASAPARSSLERESSEPIRVTIRTWGFSSRAVSMVKRLSLSDGMQVITAHVPQSVQWDPAPVDRNEA